MIYTIEFAPSAVKQLKKLNHKLQRKLIDNIEELSTNPRPGGYKKLAGEIGYRIRIGDYRVIYSIDDSIITIFVLKIAQRREVYRYRSSLFIACLRDIYLSTRQNS